MLKFVKRADCEVVAYLPYGAFLYYFCLYTGRAFIFQRGRGLGRWLNLIGLAPVNMDYWHTCTAEGSKAASTG